MIRRPDSRTARAAGVFVVAWVALGLFVGCAPDPVDGTPTASTSPSPVASAPTSPVLLPDGTAEENLPLFTATVEKVWGTEQRGLGRAYIDALISAGFDRAAMQVTQDQSTVGNPAESMQFSVRWGSDSCLVGQVGPSTGRVVTMVLPQLAGGRCLVGVTRPIDW